ncbi:hypothetical protein FH972_002801 [Carpinus fangiana]|uniref:Prolamin-like domain-containing protein n=1 Tax=Carpinus fangiana TaxID=176857 RepID=A0A5N6QFZ5_9ROSI|nr:hypothetical protein FH972_002801 [Carpinus fangiana]
MPRGKCNCNKGARRQIRIRHSGDGTARAETRKGLINCFTALMEFQQCSDEVFLIPLRRHTKLSPVCCHSISTISNRCWPSVLASFGFIAKQGNLQLHGYCEAVSRPVLDSLPKQPPRTI